MIKYREFSSRRDEVLIEYQEFYFNRFPQLFLHFYPSLRNGMVLHAVRNFNEYRSLHKSLFLPPTPGYYTENSTEEYYFSVSVFFISLIPQVIEKVSGKEATKLFHKASAWPVLSAGLAGIVSPERWLYESGDEVYPSSFESPYYCSLLDIVLPFHVKEILDFLKGTQNSADVNAYSNLCECTKNDIEKIAEELIAATKESENNFLTGNIPMHFNNKR